MIEKNKILLIVSGGIAAYKSLELIRLLKEEQFLVTPVMTASAEEFVTALSLSVLSGQKALTNLHNTDTEMSFGHIELSRQSDLIVVAPATANLLAKMANGMADDLASNILLATNKPVLVAPAMNMSMWNHEATKRNITHLGGDGVTVIGPNEGLMACGEFGYGRMAEPAEILAAIKKELGLDKVTALKGKRVLVTSGPTEEPIDPVRYISNRSSGIQGKAIAECLVRYGANVLFVSGPVNLSMPQGVEIVKVKTAMEMCDCVNARGPYDVVICVAAVSDWKVKNIKTQKIKKDISKSVLNLELIKNTDILAQVSSYNPRPKLIIGFAAETEHLDINAAQKLESKKCDWILANNVNTESGVMGELYTEVTLFSKKKKKLFPRMSKADFSELLVASICTEIE